MVKLIYCITRKPGMSVDEFQRYWRETHGPLVRRHATTLRIRRYVQTHTLEDGVQEALRASRAFALIETVEALVRPWNVEGPSVRPAHRMVAHTGFLVTARRIVSS